MTKIRTGQITNNSEAWLTWSPSYSASGSMTFTSVSTTVAKYIQIGKTVFFAIRAQGTTGGTANVSLIFTLPITALAFNNESAGGCYVIDTASISGFCSIFSTTQALCRKYDASNFGLGASRGFTVNGFYEVA